MVGRINSHRDVLNYLQVGLYQIHGMGCDDISHDGFSLGLCISEALIINVLIRPAVQSMDLKL